MTRHAHDPLQAALVGLDRTAPPVLLLQGVADDGALCRAQRAIARWCGGEGLLAPGAVRLLQPFAGLTELVEALHARALALGRSDLVESRWLAVRTIAPALAARVPARRPDPCPEYRPGDTRRRAAPFWVHRLLHSVVDLLLDLQAAAGTAPLAVGFPALDQANRRVRECFVLLARRSAGRPLLLWAAVPGRIPDDLRQELPPDRSVLVLSLLPEAALPPARRPAAVRGLPGAARLSAAELVAAADTYCLNGLWEEAAEYGRLAYERLTPADGHLLPVLAEAYRVALGDLQLAQQHLLQQLPLAATRKERVNLLGYLTLLFVQLAVDTEAGEYYGRQALAVADSAPTAAEQAELRLIASHGLLLAWSAMGRLEAANAFGAAVIAAAERLLPWAVERARRSMVLYVMAQNSERLGRLDEAIELYRASLAYDADYPEYYHFLCAALVRAGRFAEALAVAAEGLERNPPYWRLHLWRGQALAGLGRDGEAEAEYARALNLEPDAAQVLLGRALFYHERGRLSEAIADYTGYLALAPDDAEALSNRGSARHDAGDSAGALADLEAALQRNPQLVGALANRAAVLADLGRLPEALADLEQALAVEPDNPILRDSRAALQARIAQGR